MLPSMLQQKERNNQLVALVVVLLFVAALQPPVERKIINLCIGGRAAGASSSIVDLCLAA